MAQLLMISAPCNQPVEIELTSRRLYGGPGNSLSCTKILGTQSFPGIKPESS